jgi:thymidylate synthase
VFIGVYRSLPEAWVSLLREIYTNGTNVVSDHGHAKYVNGVLLEITDYAPAWCVLDPWCAIPNKPDIPSHKLVEYCKEFTYEYVYEQEKKADNEKFEYLYMTRFIRPVDQIEYVKNQLLTGRGRNSRRLQLTTWRPELDMTGEYPPCLQAIRILPHDDKGVFKADVEIHYRSWDVYGAMEANVIAEMEMVNNYILKPTGYTVDRVRLVGTNCHYYDYATENVKEILRRY